MKIALRRLAGLLLLLTPYVAVLLLPGEANHPLSGGAVSDFAITTQAIQHATTTSVSPQVTTVVSVPAPRHPKLPSSPFFENAPVKPAPPGMTQVCGVGFVKSDDDGGLRALRRAVDVDATRRWLERTASSADERARIVAMRTLYQMLADAAEQGDMQATSASADWADRFIRAASESQDPAVYAMGMQTCIRSERAVPACQLMSLEQWTRVDPDNAWPWLHVADLAARGKDEATLQEALYRASTAKRVRDYNSVPMASLMNAGQTGLSRADAAFLMVVVTGVQAATGVPGTESLNQGCSAKAVEDANRRLVCADIADLWARAPDSAFGLSIAHRLGRRAGWSSERSDAVRERAASLTQVLIQRIGRRETLSCEAFHASYMHSVAAAEFGEVEALTRYSATPPPPR